MKARHYATLILAFMLAFLLILCTGCRSIEYVPVEKTKIEYITKDSIRVDSTFVHDSVYIKEKGDTIREFRYKYIDKYIYINNTDTILKCDSIHITHIQMVEKDLNWWQRLRMNMGGASLIAIFIVVVYFILKRVS